MIFVLLSPSACYEIPVIPYSIGIPGAISEFIKEKNDLNKKSYYHVKY
jgi:hypothetical protein